jgi:hypothetical protein
MMIQTITIAAFDSGPTPLSVSTHPHGVLVRIPVDSPGILMGQYAEIAQIGHHHNCLSDAFALTRVLACLEAGREPAEGRIFSTLVADERAFETWMAEAVAQMSPDLDPVDRFLQGPDFGLAAAYLVFLLTGRKVPRPNKVVVAFPRDAASFDRCERALSAIPELRQRLGELGDSRWAPYVNIWDRLAKLLAAGERDTLDKVLDIMRSDGRQVVQKSGDGTVSFPVELLERIFPGIDAEATLASLAMDPDAPDFEVR